MRPSRNPLDPRPEFRAGAPADALVVGVLATQVFLDTYATEGIRPALAREVLAWCSPAAFAARLSHEAQTFILAERLDHLVGFAEVHLASPAPVAPRAPGAPVAHGGDVELVRLYVQRPFQRRGIGTELVRRTERLATAAGKTALWLSAWAGNDRALAFYRALGYKDAGSVNHVIEGQAFENRVLVKSPL